jgi:hypothetical protein
MDEEEQGFLRTEAEFIRQFIQTDNMAAAIERLGKLDEEEKPAIWCLFDSKERSAIKKASRGE